MDVPYPCRHARACSLGMLNDTQVVEEAIVFERKALYSPQEAAEIAGLSVSTILNYIHSEKLYAVKLSERTYRIPLASILRTFFPDQKPPPREIRGPYTKAAAERFQRELAAEHRSATKVSKVRRALRQRRSRARV